MFDFEIYYPTQYMGALFFAICMFAFPKFLIHWGVARLIQFFEGHAKVYAKSSSRRILNKHVYDDGDDDCDGCVHQDDIMGALLWAENVIALLIVVGAMSLLGSVYVAEKTKLELILDAIAAFVGYVKEIWHQAYSVFANSFTSVIPRLQQFLAVYQ